MADVLTAKRITELMAGQRNRGGHERFLRKFVASGEMYWDVGEHIEYAERVRENLASIKNTLQMKAKDCELPVRLLKVDDSTLIVANTDIVEVEAAENESDEDEVSE